MRLTVITYGTEGDTRPLIGLSCGLMNAGHEVHLMADRSTLKTAQMHGVSAQAMAGDMKAAVNPGGALSKLMKDGGDATQMAKAAARIASDNTAVWMKDVIDQARSSDAILFSGIASYVGLCAAEYLNIPAIGLGLWPMSPTREFPSPLLPPWQMPSWANLLSHRALNALMWRMFRKKINAARLEVCGQPPRTKMWRDYPILYGVSSHLVPQPKDWPENWRVCGHWSVNSPEWQPSPELAEFLSAGAPPIYIGFGSMAGFDKQRMLSVVINAVAGRRAIFYPGWSGIDTSALPDNFFIIGDTPHHWLFPRTSMVIHHGGAGTSHTASRAGVPSIILPFAGDQFFWAGRLAAVGIAPKYVPSAKIDASALSAMIQFAEKPEVRARAKALGDAMAKENGVLSGVAHIEQLLGNLSAMPFKKQENTF